MASARTPPRISVGLRTQDGEKALVIRLPEGKELVGSPMPGERLKQDRDRLTEVMANLRKNFQTSELCVSDSDVLRESLNVLGSFSNNLLMDLFHLKDYSELRNSLASMIRGGLDDLMSQERPVGLIEYEGNLEQYIPLDYLLIPFGVANWQPEGRSGCVKGLGQVLGFAFLIQRNIRGRVHVNRMIDFPNKLDIDIYADGRLRTVQQEIGFFESGNVAHFKATVQWPGNYGHDAAQVLVDRLARRRDTNFHHYACHCNTEHDNAWMHYLDFALANGDGRVQLPLKNLKDALSQLMDVQGGCEENHAITFLNACGSAVVSPFSQTSFANLFLNWFGHAGFIGTEYDIPEMFAVHFARVFYANLLKLGHLGIALFRTRWYFAKKYNNPLGLFYSLYANPDLRLSRTVNSVNL